MKKIVAISDTHGLHQDSALDILMTSIPCDIFLFAGDLQRTSYDDGKNFIDWVNKLPHTYKILTFGNHDSNWETIKEYSEKFNNIIFLNNESITVDDITIFGSPYSLNFGHWWFMESEEKLFDMYEKIPESTNILLTHTPAFGILDESNMNHKNAGSISLRDKVFQLPNLKFSVCGHIHEGYGTCNKNGVTFINASLLNEKYVMTNKPVYFNL
jgi:Icc-related predicted phosphoesterase